MKEKIQVISNKYKSNLSGPNVTISSFSSPNSFDDFDINIIDLNDENLWKNNKTGFNTINDINEFKSLQKIIINSVKSRILFIYPTNLKFGSNYGVITRTNSGYRDNYYLKDLITEFHFGIICGIFNIQRFELIYQKTTTTILDKVFNSSFTISSNTNILTKSDNSYKTTTLMLDNQKYVTTLSIESYESLLILLTEIKLINKNVDIPKWISTMRMFNDEELFNKISDCEEKIKLFNSNIAQSQMSLDENGKWKSVLYTNGDQLVEVVLEILQKMMKVDLAYFEDKKKEDFLIKLENIHFIGEIKGVNSNVKSEHVSQTDVHHQSYLDLLSSDASEIKSVKVKSILIINHQRNKPINERDPIHHTQIDLSKRNGCLIIETITLLKLFEKYLNVDISTEEIIELFSTQNGLLNQEIPKIASSTKLP